jgi:phosphoribosylaminoimidazole-succinocarboxamide synthase
MSTPLLQSEIAGIPCRRGKVRDVYDLGDKLVIVATDRISAFDWVLPSGIPDKGRILSQLTLFWLDFLKVPNHLISTDVHAMGQAFALQANVLQGRSMLVRKAKVVPFECVVRGYLAGSGWKEYKKQQTVCGIPLPAGMIECQQLPAPIFTPSTKAETGHDENISFETMVEGTGAKLGNELKERSLDVYSRAAKYAESRGIILADTKFEWGVIYPSPSGRGDGGEGDGSLILIDEVLTPDSSRFWPKDSYQPGKNPPSFDKQFVRDWLETTTWDKNSAPPKLPDEVAAKTRAKYVEAYEKLTGKKFV